MPAPLRIAFLDSWKTSPHEGSGTAVGIGGLAAGLRTLGHHVQVLRPDPTPGDDPTAEELLQRRITFNLGLDGRLERLGPFDLLVGFDIDGVFLRAGPHRPLILGLKGVAADEARFARGRDRAVLETLARFEARNAATSSLVVVPSRYSADVVSRAYGIPRSSIAVVAEPLDGAPWAELPTRARLTSPEPVILSVAHQYPRKDTVTLVRAMSLLQDRHPSVRLRIIGGGPELPALHALVGTLKLEDRVTLEGAVPENEVVRQAYAQADIFALPSRQEGFGIVFLEAMAAGLPVVAARAGGVPEVVVEGETGLLVPPGDVHALAGALSSLLRNPMQRTRLGAAGRRRSELFTPELVARAFLDEVSRAVPSAFPATRAS
jgi:phosphatidyl-myo-inositol dimannoside synthase